MKKTTGKIKTVTMAQVVAQKLTKQQRVEIAALVAMPSAAIDTSDIAEVTTLQGWMRNPLYRPVTRPVTIRLNAPDIATAQALSKTRGMPYQTYIKMLLHDALERELAK
jgi:predicted DNA binding CopG/RHH family protein